MSKIANANHRRKYITPLNLMSNSTHHSRVAKTDGVKCKRKSNRSRNKTYECERNVPSVSDSTSSITVVCIFLMSSEYFNTTQWYTATERSKTYELSVIRGILTCHLSSTYEKSANIGTGKKTREFHINFNAFKVSKLFPTIAKRKKSY